MGRKGKGIPGHLVGRTAFKESGRNAKRASMHPLDNPIWQALNTAHARFAVCAGSAKRFMPDVSPLGAYQGALGEGLQSLESIVEPGDTVGLFIKGVVAPAIFRREPS